MSNFVGKYFSLYMDWKQIASLFVIVHSFIYIVKLQI